MKTEADRLIAGLLDRIAQYCVTHSISEREFGIRVAGNHKLTSRLRKGIYSHGTLLKLEAALAGPPPPKRRPAACHPGASEVAA